MKIYKSKAFAKWANKSEISDRLLIQATSEIIDGMVEANLGGSLYKKRISVNHKGKSGGVRILLAFKVKTAIFFIFGFSKNKLSNIDPTELQALKNYAKLLLKYSNTEITMAIKNGVLIEVNLNG